MKMRNSAKNAEIKFLDENSTYSVELQKCCRSFPRNVSFRELLRMQGVDCSSITRTSYFASKKIQTLTQTLALSVAKYSALDKL